MQMRQFTLFPYKPSLAKSETSFFKTFLPTPFRDQMVIPLMTYMP